MVGAKKRRADNSINVVLRGGRAYEGSGIVRARTPDSKKKKKREGECGPEKKKKKVVADER